MLLRNFVVGLAFSLISTAALAADSDLIVKPSPNSVSKTIDKLAAALSSAGVKIVARVDHAAGAHAVGETLRPTELLIFANPKLGTPLIQGDQRVGIDLPMRALAWEDASGKVFLAVTSPAALKARYGITGRDAAIDAMGAAIDKITAVATKPD